MRILFDQAEKVCSAPVVLKKEKLQLEIVQNLNGYFEMILEEILHEIFYAKIRRRDYRIYTCHVIPERIFIEYQKSRTAQPQIFMHP